jgi:hypothetical protein
MRGDKETLKPVLDGTCLLERKLLLYHQLKANYESEKLGWLRLVLVFE